MTKRGLKLIAEIRFDVDQLTVQCENDEERRLVSELDDAIKKLDSHYDKYYNRRKDEVLNRSRDVLPQSKS